MSLKITFRAGREELARIREAVPRAVTRGEVCELKIDAEYPAEVEAKARALLEKLRAVG